MVGNYSDHFLFYKNILSFFTITFRRKIEYSLLNNQPIETTNTNLNNPIQKFNLRNRTR